METNFKKLMIFATAALTFAACADNDVYDENFGKEDPTEVARKIDASFDYKLTAEVPVTFNYNREGALIEIYDADSTSVDVLRSGVRAHKIYSAFTGANGTHRGTMVVPASLIGKKVYAFSKSIGVTYKVEGLLTKSGLTINEPSHTRTRVQNMDKQGIPAGIRNAIESELSEGGDHSDLLKETDINIKVNKDVDYIEVTFVWGGAGAGHWTGFWKDATWNCQNGEAEPAWVCNNYKCNLYYFTYTDGNEPTAEEIERDFINDEHLVISGADQNTSNDLMGTTVRLTVNGSTRISKGTRIGWVVTHPEYELAYKWPAERASFDQFKTTFDVETPYTNFTDFAANWRMPYIYSINSLNPDGKNQSIRYTYGSGDDEVIVYGIEDLSVTRGNFIWGEEWGQHEQHIANSVAAQFPFYNMVSDKDYNDVMFIVRASDPTAIIDEEIPDMPEVDEVYSSESTEGTLLYEDLYPEQGDYDMNDVVITYKLTKFFDKDNKLVKLGYEFTPVWSGANYHSSFSFLIDDYIETPVKVFSDQQDYVTAYGPTQNLTTFKGEVSSGKLVGKNKDDLKWDAFNPYITVAQTGYEVHLTKKSPSPEANLEGLDEYQKAYVNDSNFPFAMNIPTQDYIIVTERVRIDREYPRFSEWVLTSGEQATDWYEHRGE